jgi:hypothetical protein
MLRLTNALGAIAALGAAIMFAATPANAQTINGATPSEVAELMEGMGLEVEHEYLDDAEGPALSAFFGDTQFLITFEACDEDGEECELIVFRCGFAMDPDDQPDLETLNVWNSTKWGKAMMDDEGDPWVILEVNTVGGITEENLVDTFEWWENMIVEFTDFIGFE